MEVADRWRRVPDRWETIGTADGGGDEGASGLLGAWGGACGRRRGRELVEECANALFDSSSKYYPLVLRATVLDSTHSKRRIRQFRASGNLEEPKCKDIVVLPSAERTS